MSAGGLKKPLYQLAKFDSRNAQDIGNKIGGKVGDFIENEGKLNTQNPGRGITKGLEAIAAYYAGGALGGAFGAGAGTAGSTAATAGEAAIPTAAEGAFQGLSTATTDQLMQQAALQAAQQGAAQAAEQSAVQAAPQSPGLLSSILSKPLGPGGIPAAPGMAPQAAMDSARLAYQGGATSPAQYAIDAAKARLMSAGSALSTPQGQLAAKTGMGLLQPQQQQMPQPMPQRPMQQIQPVPSPYSMQGPNTPPGLPPGMTLQQLQELLRRQQMMGGYQ